VSTHTPNKTSKHRHVFGLKKKSLHPWKPYEQFTRTCKNLCLLVPKK
jgi:hypothetical protein